MNRNDIEFAVHYSCRLESMSATLMGRVDKGISLIQFCLGASAFASFMSIQAIGCLVVILSAFALVYQPGVKAALAEIQKKQYAALAARMSSLTDDELATEYTKIQEADSAAIGALCNAAYNGELIRLDLPPLHTLSVREKVLAWLAGDLPKAPQNPARTT